MKIIWTEVPGPVRSFVEPSVKKWVKVLPKWLEAMEVKYLASEDSLASMQILPQYREALLMLHGKTLEDDDIENTILHEFIHVSFEPVRRIYQRTLRNFLEDFDATRKTQEEALEDAMEGMVCDMAYGIQRLLK